MPITCMSACMAVFGVLLFIPAALSAWLLRRRGRQRTAAFVMGIPCGIIGLSILAAVLVFAMMWLYGVHLSQNPARLFEKTFGFKPPPGTEVFEAYAELGMDWENRVMTFRAPRDVIDRICAGKFALSDRQTCEGAYKNNADNLPDRVRSWSLPAVTNADSFYRAKPFDASFSLVNEAILCYSEKTGIACFHWSGMD